MSVLYIGDIALNKLYHQPESRFEVARDGTVRATEVYTARTESARRLAVEFQGRAHPEIPYIGVDTIAAEEQEGGLSRIVVNYAGASFDTVTIGDAATSVYTLRKQPSGEPIETAPIFAELTAKDIALVKKWHAAIKDRQQGMDIAVPDDAPTWAKDIETKTSKQLAGADLSALDPKGALLFYLLRGTDTFEDIRMEFTSTTVLNRTRTFARNLAVGKIGTPPAICPKFPGRDWRFVGTDETVEGHAYRIVSTWRLSGDYGWDKPLYAPIPKAP